MADRVPHIQLPNGCSIPVLSIGTYKVEHLDEVVAAGMAAGIRAVDTAEHYHNEAEVGRVLSAYPRDSFYLSTKIWNEDHGYQRTLDVFEQSVERLRTEPDMLMIHWPCPMNGLYQETWRALQRLLQDGRVKAIGVSNFKVHHLEALKALGGVQPMVNQVEMHPFFIDWDMMRYTRENGMVMEAWSPLLRGKTVISDPLIMETAGRYGRSPAQLAIRYLTQYGVRAIVKSSNPVHVSENASIFDFELTPEDMKLLQTLHTGKRFFQDPDDYYL